MTRPQPGRSEPIGGVDSPVQRYRARWVLPIAGPPIPEGTVTIVRGRVVDVAAGPAREPPPIELGSVAVLPGLVNAHTHLELSSLRGRVRPADTMPGWVRTLMAARSEREVGAEAVAQTIDELRASGTALVGDVTNSLASARCLATSDVSARLFYELIGFAVEDGESMVAGAWERVQAVAVPDHLRVSLAAHAPYSVSPALLSAIRDATAEPDPIGIHLAESAEECEFLRHGTGAWRRLLDELGAWDPTWAAPGCEPVEYLARCQWLRPGLVATHGVQLGDAQLERLASTGACLVTCPRSNAWTGAGRPDVERFYRSGVPVAIGTDSLASCPDVNVFHELAELRRLAPSVPARTLLRSATQVGASALGFQDQFGTIEPGKRAALITVDVPADSKNVEEYLLEGIEPERVRWIEEWSEASPH